MCTCPRGGAEDQARRGPLGRSREEDEPRLRREPLVDPDAAAAVGVERHRARSVLLFSHYGPVEEVQGLCDLAERRLRRWADVVRDAATVTDDAEEVGRILDERTRSEFDEAPAGVDVDAARTRYELLASMAINGAGLTRYWRKRWEREAEPGAGAPSTPNDGSGPAAVR